MNDQEFNNIFEAQIEACSNTLGVKAAEYASDEDRLYNFRVAANLQTVTDIKALGGMMAKHTVSIYDMIERDVPAYPIEIWNEKITDHINYLILLRAILAEEYTNATKDNHVSGP